MRQLAQITLCLGLLVLGPVLPAVHATSTVAITADGAYHAVLEGLYMELFPEGDAVAPWNSVLALERTDALGTQRFLVPGSEDISIDSRASLIGDGKGLFVLWASSRGTERSEFELVHFDGITFGTPIELSGDPQQLKGPPRVGITRDSYPLTTATGGDGTEVTMVQRTTLHLVWWEAGATGALSVLYTPVVLLDGEYLGWNPVLSLDSFDPHDALDQPIGHDAFLQAATVDSSSPDSVVVALPQLDTGRLLGLRVDVLPAQLQSLSDEIRSHIVGVGRAIPAEPGGLQEIIDYIRSHIVGVGRADFHPGVLEHVADRVVATLEEQGEFDPNAVDELADLAGLEALRAGASLLGDPRTGSSNCGIVAIDPAFHAVTTSHYLQICRTADRPLPETPQDVEHHLALGEDGRRMMVIWSVEDRLYFVSSDSEGWSDQRTLELPPGIARHEALEALLQQIRASN